MEFFWGAATSSHQVEGGNTNDWSVWEKTSAASKVGRARLEHWPDYVLNVHPDPLQEENYISGGACDHYNRFREDFDIAKSLGHNAHRFSIEWSRIEPEEGKFDEKEIAHYRDVIRALRERDIEPFVTLWHWTLPIWLAKKGGVRSGTFAAHFESYAGKIADALGNDVRFWLTVNEPEVYSSHSYYSGKWPPQKKNLWALYGALSRLAAAHRQAYRAIKEKSPSAQVGAALHLVYFESAGGFINALLKRIADRTWNFRFLNRIRESLDFIGVNYYHHNRIDYGFNKNANAEVSDMQWEIFPEGLYHVLKGLNAYGKPIYVTENGLADLWDSQRAKFIKDHVDWMKKAMKEGVDVRGYFHWSLLDNFEWDKGFWPRFGLVDVNHGTLERKIRASAWEYKKIISSQEQKPRSSEDNVNAKIQP